MAEMAWLTRGGIPPLGLPRIYLACHPGQIDPIDAYIMPLANDLVALENCSVWYDADQNADHNEPDTVWDLTQMSIFVFPVTKALLNEPNRARDIDLPIALEQHIPILPIMMETGLDDDFSRVFGDLQYLDRVTIDETATPYSERLQGRLSEVISGAALAERVRSAFIARAFLSYRKKDRLHAQQLMRLLHDHPRGRDIAIWYDEFLVPGEDFNEAIAASLEGADLFLLAVTPNLLENPNYVMTTEYPLALERNKHIVAVNMVDTDEDALRSHYQNLPNMASGTSNTDTSMSDKPTLEELIDAALDAINAADPAKTPEQEYLIGVAYMGGIDVEINRARGIELITSAAESGYAEAMDYLAIVYWSGNGVERNWTTSVEWTKRAVAAYESAYRALPETSNKKEQAAIWYQAELNALITRLNILGHLTEAEQACLQLKEFSEEWRTWSNSQESFIALYGALSQLVTVCLNQLQLTQAQEYCDQAYTLLIQRKTTNISEELDELILGNLMQGASIALMQMNFSMAYDAYLEALPLAEALASASYTVPHMVNTMNVCNGLGTIDLIRCSIDDAAAQFRRALTIAEELTAINSLNEELKLIPQGYLAQALLSAGSHTDSLAIAEEGILTAAQVRSYTDASSAWTAAFSVYMAKGSCLFELHRWDDCRALGNEMLELGGTLKNNEGFLVNQLMILGQFYCCYANLNQGMVSEALSSWEQMRSCLPADWEQAEDTDTLRFGARLLECKGLIDRVEGKPDDAIQLFDKMRKIAQNQLDQYGLFQAGLDYGYACIQSCELTFDMDDIATASQLAAEACKTFEALVSAGKVAANTRYYCHALCLAGKASLAEGCNAKAFDSLSKAAELGDDLLTWDESEDSRTVVSDCHFQLAEYFLSLDDKKRANEQYFKTFEISLPSLERARTLRTLFDLANIGRAIIALGLREDDRIQSLKESVASLEYELNQKASEIKNFRALF